VDDEEDNDIQNNLWRQDLAWQPWESPDQYQYRGVDNCFRRSSKNLGTEKTIEASLGFLPPYLRIPLLPADDENDGDDKTNANEAGTPPFPWLTWLNRDFVSPHELLLVPKSSPSRLLRDHTHEWPFHHLFFGGGHIVPADKDADEGPGEGDPTGYSVFQARLGLLEFLRVPSRFADAEQRILPDDAVAISNRLVASNARPLFLPPHNYLSHFREPGRINLNTITSADVWAAVTGGRPAIPYEDEIHYASDGTPQGFSPSEDWNPAAKANGDSRGTWLYTTAKDTEPNGNENERLDLNHDDNNDGHQAVSDSPGNMQSLAASRRGWEIAANPTNSVDGRIAGEFDRILNRRGCTGNRGWFDNAFRSGWSGANYQPEQSLLLRTSTRSSAPMRYVRLSPPAEERYGRLVQRRISLTGGIMYDFEIKISGTFEPSDDDYFPGLASRGNNVALPGTTRTDGDVTTITGQYTPELSGLYDFKLALYSKPTLVIRSVSFRNAAGVELLANGNFSAGLLNWEVVGGTAEVVEAASPARPSMPLLTKRLDFGSEDATREGHDYADPKRNPYFLYQDVMRLSNLVTTRSNVFAIWSTVGFFELDEQGRLGREYGLDAGNVIRHRAFQILDRSIPVGYQPGDESTPPFEGNLRESLLLDHYLN